VATVLGLVACAGCVAFLGFMRNNTFGLAEYQRGMGTGCDFGQSYNCHPIDINTTTQYHVFPLYSLKLCGGTCEHLWGAGADRIPGHDSRYPFSVSSDSGNLFAPGNFPYSSAVENTVLFLLLCLTSQLAVLSARVDGWFFTRRPGYVLLTIISVQMIFTTVVAAAMRTYPFWDPNSSLQLVRLTKIDGRYIGSCWLFALCLFLVMETIKYAVYRLMALNNTREEQRLAAIKQREDLRRRMTRNTMTRHGTVSAGGSHAGGSHGYVPPASGHGGSLAPTPVAAAPAYRPSQSKPRKGGELGAPLLMGDEENYAL
jgi:hypothetical protein